MFPQIENKGKKRLMLACCESDPPRCRFLYKGDNREDVQFRLGKCDFGRKGCINLIPPVAHTHTHAGLGRRDLWVALRLQARYSTTSFGLPEADPWNWDREPPLRGLRPKRLGRDGGAARLAWGGCISPAETQAAAWGRKQTQRPPTDGSQFSIQRRAESAFRGAVVVPHGPPS